jgi:glucoamylase
LPLRDSANNEENAVFRIIALLLIFFSILNGQLAQASRAPAAIACSDLFQSVDLNRETSGRRKFLTDLVFRMVPEMLANISPKGAAPGAVIAARSKTNPPYYYVWKRDAAIVMTELWNVAKHSKKSSTVEAIVRKLLDYADFVKKLQETFVSGDLGEPKFEVTGEAFNEQWGRPQNDGPALESELLIDFARSMINDGQGDYVRTKLYDGKGNGTSQTVIKRNLEYILHHWKDKNFDAWEEVNGDHFFTRFHQHRALSLGATFAEEMGDFEGARQYKKAVSEIAKSLHEFYNKETKTFSATRNPVGEYNRSGLDILTLMATVQAYGRDMPIRPSDVRMLNTAYSLLQRFREVFPINGNLKKVLAIGRYPEDKYMGGNPWYIGNATFAAYYGRVRQDLAIKGRITIRDESLKFFKNLLSGFAEEAAIQVGAKFDSNHLVFKKILSELRNQGEMFLELPNRVGKSGVENSEQFHKESGEKWSADYLTWNYAAYLLAMRSLNNKEK